MNRQLGWMMALALCIALLTERGTLAADKSSAAQVALEAARKKEVVDGDLKSAIQQYKNIVSKYADQRSAVADALVRMAECYRKQGDSQARKIFEQVVRDYADQKEAVAIARAQLGQAPAGLNPGNRRVLTGKNVDFQGSMSPDGRYLSIETDGKGSNLGIYELATGKLRVLTNSENENIEAAYKSQFSPDGKQIAYSWADWSDTGHRELRVIGTEENAKPRTLYSGKPEVGFIGPAGWSPDGKWIAVSVQRGDLEEIGIVSPTNGELRILWSTKERSPGRVFFSPDGKYLAMDRPAKTGAQHDVFILSVNGGTETAAVTSPEDNTVMAWMADGRLLYTQDHGKVSLWALQMVNGNPQGAPVQVWSDVGTTPLGVTRSGGLYYATHTGGSDLYVAAFDENAGRIVSVPAVPLAQGSTQPEWSADGKYLAYRSPNGITVRSVETGETRLVAPPWSGNNAKWAPDGRFFVVDKRNSATTTGVYRIDAQTGESELIVQDVKEPSTGAPNPGITDPVLSPDGKKLYYRYASAKEQNYAALMERNLSSGAQKELIRRTAMGVPNLTPDGKYIVTGVPGQALLIPTDSGPVRELFHVSDPQRAQVFMFAPDSKSVYLKITMQNEIWRVPFDGGAATKIDLNFDIAKLAGQKISPNGRQIAYVQNQGPSVKELWVLENFLPPLVAAK